MPTTLPTRRRTSRRFSRGDVVFIVLAIIVGGATFWTATLLAAVMPSP